MGKGAAHWKRIRNADSITPPSAPVQTAPKAPLNPQCHSSERDSVFGTPLDYTVSHWLVLPDYDRRRPKRYQYAIPYRIHERDCAQRNRNTPQTLGEPPWTKRMEHYMDGWQRKEDTDWKYWWRVPYVVDRVLAFAQTPMETRPKYRFTYDDVNAFLACRRKHEAGYLPEWIEGAGRKITRYVRDTFLPHEPRDSRVGA